MNAGLRGQEIVVPDRFNSWPIFNFSLCVLCGLSLFLRISGACAVSFCRQTLVKLWFFRHAGMIGGLKICILILEGNLAAIPFL
jgi:hypothetical protein